MWRRKKIVLASWRTFSLVMLFAGLDDIIIDWALEQLNDEILDAQIDGLNIAQVADQRMFKAYHYSKRYKNKYTTITINRRR